MKIVKLALVAGVLASMSGIAMAGGGSSSSSNVIEDDMLRRDPGSASGSGHTVEANCAIDPTGNAWQGATAEVEVKQKGSTSVVEVEIEDAIPNTLFTVWVRIKGKNGLNSAGSPLTAGGATPLAPGTELVALNAISPWNDAAGASSSSNSFTTNGYGKGKLKVYLDFPVVGGAYPFQKMVGPAHPTKGGGADVPTAIANPADAGQGSTPFLFRVVSHCTDNMSHGLSPATREAWFQYP